ncbi:MAG: hypothetical protein FMNOHCHN_03102 [Ignavibacteriaceae bacterium]|nr:hypothetical protein [Ignavibacteriaceae bacterium]
MNLTAKLIILIIALAFPLSSQVTSHRYFQTFDNGGSEGYAVFSADVDVSVQNGGMVISTASTDMINIMLPLGATTGDFTYRINSSSSGNITQGAIGRAGFKSEIGVVIKNDTVRVFYTVDIQSYPNPSYTMLYSGPMPSVYTGMQLSGIRSGNDLIVAVQISGTTIYQGTIPNADPSLFSGSMYISVLGDGNPYNISLDEIEINYNPYVSTPGSFSDDFSNPISPWSRFGDFNVIAQSVNISGGKLNFTYNGVNPTTLLAAPPVGAVRDFTFEATGSGTLGSDGVGAVSRGSDLKHYITVFWEDDSVYIGYADGFYEPVIVARTSSNVPGTRSKVEVITSGSNQVVRLYMDNVLVMTGTIVNPSERLKTGHMMVSYERTNQINISIDDVATTYTSVLTSAAETGVLQSGDFTLQQNYPNPFNPSTTINYTLSGAGISKLILYDVLGNTVTELASGYHEAGSHTATLNAVSYKLTSGVYYARLTSNGQSQTIKLILMK